MKLRHLIGTAVALLLVACCGSAPAEPADGSAARVDRFDAERAWRLVEHQVGVGQRPAGSPQLRRLARRLRPLLSDGLVSMVLIRNSSSSVV